MPFDLLAAGGLAFIGTAFFSMLACWILSLGHLISFGFTVKYALMVKRGQDYVERETCGAYE